MAEVVEGPLATGLEALAADTFLALTGATPLKYCLPQIS